MPVSRFARTPPLVAGSKVLHAAAAAAVVARPDSWPFALGAVAANHAALLAAVMSPRSQWLGDSLVRLDLAGAVVLTFDDGPDPLLTPATLEILAAHDAHASFFCIGQRARACPGLVREIVAGGHTLENHSERHLPWFACLGPAGLTREVAQTQDVLADLAGVRPRFFRAPMGFRSPLLEQVLRPMGLRHVAWTRRGFDTVNGSAHSILRRLTTGLAGGDILLLHDGRSARAGTTPVLLQVLPALLQRIRDAGLRAVSLAALSEQAVLRQCPGGTVGCPRP